jgi:hypothetical protein
VRKPCKQHTNISGAYRALLTEEEYAPDGKPQVSTDDLYFCIECGATFRNDFYEQNGIGPLSPGNEIYWRLPVIWRKP